MARRGVSLNVEAVPRVKMTLVSRAVHAAFLNTGSPHHVEWLILRQLLDSLDLAQAALTARHHSDCALADAT